MGTPGFTAETSVYRTSASYRSLATGSDRLTGGVVNDLGWASCGALGEACCHAPTALQNVSTFGPLVSCQQGLGCDITTNKCVSTCGATGQVCCDGPETRAPKWTADGRIDSPNAWNMREMCDTGACDKQTHRCITCGTQDGGVCCSSDAAQVTARCFRDAKTGNRLVCHDRWANDPSGMCLECGKGLQPGCRTGGEAPCDDGLVERDGICVPCGNMFGPTCDRGEPCRDGASVTNRSGTECIPAGGPNQPCLSNGFCEYQGTFCNSKHICQPCGDPGQICCPPGNIKWPSSEDGRCLGPPGECLNNRCFACGYIDLPVCPGNDPCRYGGEPVDGWCRPCGKEGQVCCRSLSIYCESGMKCEDNVCRRPSQPPPPPPPGQWKTCNGENWGISTKERSVFIKHAANQCIDEYKYNANSVEEAYTCARREHGNDTVVTEPIYPFKFALTSQYGCHTVTFKGTDDAGAQTCAQWQCVNCNVTSGDCP